MSRDKYSAMAKDTLEIAKQYRKIRFSDYYSALDLINLKNEKFYFENVESVIEVNNKDVIESVLNEYGNGKLAILNFASAKNPGGGFLKGASAQEESICRVSDLYYYIEPMSSFYENPNHYKNGLYDSDLIYSKDVSVIKDSNGNFIRELVKMDVITSCAVNVTDLKNKKQFDLLKEVDNVMTERIENIFEIALRNEIDVLILGAWGCGGATCS